MELDDSDFNRENQGAYLTNMCNFSLSMDK